MNNTVAAPAQINPITAPASDAVGGQQLSSIQPMQMAGVPTMSVNSNVASTPGGLSQAQILQAIGTNAAGSYAAGQALDSMGGSSGYGGAIYNLAQGNDRGAATSAASNYAADQYGGAAGLGVSLAANYGHDNSTTWGSTLGGYAGGAIGGLAGPAGAVAGSAIGSYLGGALGNALSKCFITQAVMAAIGKDDDSAHELQVLRAWRDGYMLRSPKLVPLVREYYAIAPLVVAAIDRRPDAKRIYINLYHQFILPTVQAIMAGNMELALHIYTEMLKAVTPLAQQAEGNPVKQQAMQHLSNHSALAQTGALSQLPQGAQ